VFVDFVNPAMDAVVNVVNDTMQPVVQMVKEAGISARFGSAGIRDAAQTEDGGDKK
jgi:hypothetical protein